MLLRVVQSSPVLSRTSLSFAVKSCRILQAKEDRDTFRKVKAKITEAKSAKSSTGRKKD